MSEPTNGAAELARSVAAGKRSAASTVDATLKRAEELQDLGIFWALDRDRARDAAERIDERVAAGEGVGPLAGVPVAIKDSLDVIGLPTSFGVGGEFPAAERDAEPVGLTRAADGVPLGKSSMDQLGWTTGGHTPERGRTVNPRDHARSPGGSSAGSAAAVAAGLTPLAIGTDAAGSVRIPASYCGVVGFMPPVGAIPTGGMRITVEGFDCVGVIAASMQDVWLGFAALSGQGGPGPQPGEDGAAAAGHGGAPTSEDLVAAHQMTIGRLEDLFEASDALVAERCSAVLDRLEPPLSIAPTRLEWEPKGMGRAMAGGLARSWGDEIEASPERFSPMIRESIAFGRQVPDEDLKAIHDRFVADRAELEARLSAFDVLASPTVPIPVPLAEEETVEVSIKFTRLFNALGWPAISLPVGTDDAGMPVGLQLASPPHKLDVLLSAADAVELAVAD